jgi:hypothetical protein
MIEAEDLQIGFAWLILVFFERKFIKMALKKGL